MRESVLSSLSLSVALLLGLAGCSASEPEALRKDVETLRSDLQRVQKENERLAARVTATEQRVNGLAADVPMVRELAMSGKQAAPGTEPAPAAAETPPSESPSAVAPSTEVPGAPAIKAYLTTDDGRKVLAAAIAAEREERDREQQKRRVDAMVDRFARDAGLNEDQTKKMKDILVRTSSQVREVWSSLREMEDATQEQREAQRQQNMAKIQELNQKTDDEVRNVLSNAQFEQYQKQQDRLRSTMRGAGVGMPAGGGGVNGRRGNQ